MTEKQNRLLNAWGIDGAEVEDKYVMTEVLNPELNTQEGYFNEEKIEYNINRAKGGAGIITVGVHAVDAVNDNNKESNFIGVADSYHYTSEVGEMIDQIHDYGARVFVPLTAGGQINTENMNELSRQSSAKEMEKMTKAFVHSALMAKLIGYDGVQINAVQEGYLLKQFSNAFCNLSGFDSEKSLETRLAFVTIIVKEIKRVCGSDFPVTLRFRVNSFVDTVIKETEWDRSVDVRLGEIPEAIDAVKILAIAGFDALDIDAGAGNSWCLTNDPSLAENEGFYLEEKKSETATETPAFGYGMIEDIEIAANALDDGIYDAISMEHLLYANEDYLNKIHTGKYEDMTAFMH